MLRPERPRPRGRASALVTAALCLVLFVDVAWAQGTSAIVRTGATYDAFTLGPSCLFSAFYTVPNVDLAACYRNTNVSSIRIDRITARYSVTSNGQTLRFQVQSAAAAVGFTAPSGTLLGSNPNAAVTAGPLAVGDSEITASFLPSTGSPVVVGPNQDFCVVWTTNLATSGTTVDPRLELHSCPLDSGKDISMQNTANYYALARTTGWGSINPTNQFRHRIEYSVYALPAPGAPTGLTVAPLNPGFNPGATVTWSWSSPSSPQQATPTVYYVTFTPQSGGVPTLSYSTPASPFSLASGLTPGITYTVSVLPSNSVSGNGTAATTSFTPAAVAPTAPQSVLVASLGAPVYSAGSNNAQSTGTITWTAPLSSGGSAILSYTATATPTNCPPAYAGACPTTVSQNVGPSTFSASLSPLLAGVNYTITVTATNSQGTGLAGTASNSPAVVPALVPQGTFAAPTFPSAASFVSQAAGTNQATALTAPAYNGGSPISAYALFFTPTNADTGALDRRLQASAFSVSAGAAPGTTTVTGLVPGITYTVVPQATNGVGAANGTAATLAVPAVTPLSPTGVVAVAVDSGTLQVSWAAPAWNGGSPVTNYNVTITGPASGTNTAGLNAGDGTRSFPFLCSAAVCTFAAANQNAYPAVNASVTSLQPGGTYTGRVSTLTQAGLQSPPGVSNAVTLPVTPVTVTVSADDPSASVTARWAVAPGSTAGPVTGYTVTIRDQSGNVLQTATNLPATAANFTFTGLPLATRLSVTVQAVTATQTYSSDPAYAQLAGRPPGNVVSPSVTDVGPQTARGQWNASSSAPTAPILNYTLELTPIEPGSNPNAALRPTGPSITTPTAAPSPPTLPVTLDVARVAPGTTYAARVTACNAFGCTAGPYVAFAKPATPAPVLVDVTTPITAQSATAIFQPAGVWQPWNLSPTSYVVVATPAALANPAGDNATHFPSQAAAEVAYPVALADITPNGFFLANFSSTAPNTAYIVRVHAVYASLGPGRGSPSNARTYIAPADVGLWCSVQSPTVPVVLAGMTAAAAPSTFLGALPNITASESFTVDIRLNSVGCFEVFDVARLRSVVGQVAAALNATVARMRVVYLRCAFGTGVSGSPCAGSWDLALRRQRGLRQAAVNAAVPGSALIPTATTFGTGQLVIVATVLPVTVAGDTSMPSNQIYANMLDLSRRQAVIPVGTAGTAQLTSNGAAVRSVVIVEVPTPTPAPVLRRDEGGGLSGGALIAAIVVPVVVGALLLLCCLWCLCLGVSRRRRKDEYIYERTQVEAFQPVGPPPTVGYGVSYTAVPISQEVTYGNAAGMGVLTPNTAATTLSQHQLQLALPGTPAQAQYILPGSPVPVGSPTPLLAAGSGYYSTPTQQTTTTTYQKEYYLSGPTSPGYI
eukprot:tig00020556_g11043.t1